MSPNTQPTKEMCYYIAIPDFNDLSTKEIAYYIRDHWEVEDRLRWQQKDTPSLKVRKTRSWRCSLRPDDLEKILGF